MSETDFLLDTSEDDNVRIHRHTNGKDDTGYAGSVSVISNAVSMMSTRPTYRARTADSSHTRDKVKHHHEYGNDRKTDGTCL